MIDDPASLAAHSWRSRSRAGAVVLALVAAACLGVRLCLPDGAVWHLVGWCVGWGVVAASIGLAIGATIIHSNDPTRDLAARRFWRQSAAVFVLFGTAALAQALISLVNGTTSHVWLIEAGYLPPLVVLLYGLLRLPIPHRSRTGWHTLMLDVSIMAVAFCLLAWFFAAHRGDVMRGVAPSDIAAAGLVVLAAAGVTAVAKLALVGAVGVSSRAMATIGATSLLAVLTSGIGKVLLTDARVECAQLVLPLFALGYVLATSLDCPAATATERAGNADRRQFSLLPYGAILTVLAVDVISQARQPQGGSAGVLSLGAASLTALIIARQLTAFRENARLLVELDANLREVAAHEHRLGSLLRHSSDVITVMDEHGLTRYASPGVVGVLHSTPEELENVCIRSRVHTDDRPAFDEVLRRLVATAGLTLIYQARLSRPDSTYRWLEIVSTNLLQDPDIAGIVSNARDITDNRRYQDELTYQATHDELTGLPNRALFTEATGTALAGENPDRLAIVLVDLDDFKTINDRLGHAVGDGVLRAVGHRLASGLRPGDMVARLGGDEFAVLLHDVDGRGRRDYATQILEQISAPVSAGEHDLLVRGSGGVSSGEAGVNAGELLRRADVAMYTAKELGRGRSVEFDEAMDLRAREHARVAADLSVALERGELHLQYQPIVALPSGTLAGVEALLRWVHPNRGMISPVQFIPVAERTGLIVPLGEWVLHEACQQAATWLRRYGDSAPERISVNVSARQLIDPDFPDTVKSALVASGLPADRLTVEITETAVFDGGPALEAVQAMRALGIRVALDDFGTGHSSLGLLRTCPVDELKVDKSFVDGVAQSLEQEAIVTSVSQIGTAMRLQVVAEGVETAVQANRLHVLGYRFAQGFHFARPMTADAIEAELARAPVTPVYAA